MRSKVNSLLGVLFWGAVVLVVPLLFSQEGVRSREAMEAERQAKELFSSEEYAKAIPILEHAVQSSPADLTDISLLGMAYLYSSSHVEFIANLPKAQATMEKAIEQGGEAVFLVGRADDPLKSLSPHVVKAIQGELRIGKTSLSFVPSRSATGKLDPVAGTDIKECGLNRSYGKDSNSFHLKIVKETVNFRPLHFSKDESDLVCSLAAKYLGVKIVN